MRKKNLTPSPSAKGEVDPRCRGMPGFRNPKTGQIWHFGVRENRPYGKRYIMCYEPTERKIAVRGSFQVWRRSQATDPCGDFIDFLNEFLPPEVKRLYITEYREADRGMPVPLSAEELRSRRRASKP